MFEKTRKSLIFQHWYLLANNLLFEWAKNAENGQFGEFVKNWSLRSNSVTRQVNFNWEKIGGKYQNSKIQMRQFWLFSKTFGPKIQISTWEKFELGTKIRLLPQCVLIKNDMKCISNFSKIQFWLEKSWGPKRITNSCFSSKDFTYICILLVGVVLQF